MIERPLMIGFLWGLFGGEWATTLSVAIFFELFWLDAIPAGTYIPPHLAACTVACLALTTRFGLSQPAQVMVPLFLSMPLAWLGTHVEQALREWQNRNYSFILQWARHSADPSAPSRLVLRAVVVTAAASWLFFLACILVLAVLTDMILSRLGPDLTGLPLTWAPLWISAGIGGVLSLRLRKAQAAFAAGAAGVMIFALAGVL